MALLNLSASAELQNILLFLKAVGLVACYTGLVFVVPIAAVDTWLRKAVRRGR